MHFATIAYLWLDVAVHGSICITSLACRTIQKNFDVFIYLTFCSPFFSSPIIKGKTWNVSRADTLKILS